MGQDTDSRQRLNLVAVENSEEPGSVIPIAEREASARALDDREALLTGCLKSIIEELGGRPA